VRDWVLGTPAGDWTSAGIMSSGEYGVAAGLVSSFPVTSSGGDWQVVEGISIDEFSCARIDASVAQRVEEPDTVRELELL